MIREGVVAWCHTLVAPYAALRIVACLHPEFLHRTLYAPNLNLIDRFWGHLKRSAIHNYYFQTVENLEDAILRAIHSINRQLDHPFRLHLKTVQPLLVAAQIVTLDQVVTSSVVLWIIPTLYSLTLRGVVWMIPTL